ncbi:hypothetical protein J4Q44_G00373220, partial [Coregonus suidteri]
FFFPQFLSVTSRADSGASAVQPACNQSWGTREIAKVCKLFVQKSHVAFELVHYQSRDENECLLMATTLLCPGSSDTPAASQWPACSGTTEGEENGQPLKKRPFKVERRGSEEEGGGPWQEKDY